EEGSPMPSYLFVESCDPFESRDVEEGYRLVTELAAQHIPVTLFLVQNGVLVARQGSRASQFTALVANPGVTVLSDSLGLQGRGMSLDGLVPGVQAWDIDTLVDLPMADGQKAIWH